jgi:FkbM family methyltransferase
VTTKVNWLHSTLMRVRPAQLGAALKRVLRIRRTVVASDAGHQFWADPVSVFGRRLAETGTYEPRMTTLLQAVLRPADVFVDIGGNEGYFSVVAAALVGAGGVYCVEPQSRLKEIIKKNFELNGSDVVLSQCALSNHNGHVDLYLRPSTNTGASSVFRHWKVGSSAERVATATLDSFFE